MQSKIPSYPSGLEATASKIPPAQTGILPKVSDYIAHQDAAVQKDVMDSYNRTMSSQKGQELQSKFENTMSNAQARINAQQEKIGASELYSRFKNDPLFGQAMQNGMEGLSSEQKGFIKSFITDFNTFYDKNTSSGLKQASYGHDSYKNGYSNETTERYKDVESNPNLNYQYGPHGIAGQYGYNQNNPGQYNPVPMGHNQQEQSPYLQNISNPNPESGYQSGQFSTPFSQDNRPMSPVEFHQQMYDFHHASFSDGGQGQQDFSQDNGQYGLSDQTAQYDNSYGQDGGTDYSQQTYET